MLNKSAFFFVTSVFNKVFYINHLLNNLAFLRKNQVKENNC